MAASQAGNHLPRPPTRAQQSQLEEDEYIAHQLDMEEQAQLRLEAEEEQMRREQILATALIARMNCGCFIRNVRVHFA